MAIIPARAPYKITQNVDNLSITISVWCDGDTPPANPQYTVNKTSYEDGVPEDLSIDISPYIRNYFDMIPVQTPSSSTIVSKCEFLSVELNINGTIDNHNAVNGWSEPSTVFHFDRWQTKKSIYPETLSQITISKDVTTVDYVLSDGTFTTLTPTDVSRYPVIPVAFNDLSDTNSLKIVVHYPGNDIIYPFSVDCPYNDNTIGFVNSVGQWEYFDALGKVDVTDVRTSSDYIRASDHSITMSNANVRNTYTFRTGWVDDAFRRVVGDLMASEHIVRHQGSIINKMKLVDNSKERLFTRADGMLSYEFTFEYAETMIPTI